MSWRTLSRAEKFVWILLAAVTLALSIQRTLKPGDDNNFLIFRSSFLHLASFQDLYLAHPADHFDYFKYGPTFAALMMPWTWIPPAAGAVLWNVLALALFAGSLFSLNLTSSQRTAVAWICLPELVGNLQNFQSNAQLAALFVLTWYSLGIALAAAAGALLGPSLLRW